MAEKTRIEGRVDKSVHWHGVDFHVLMTLLFRGWSIVAGAMTVLVLSSWLTPVEQGYYYTFSSILGLQIIFELGLSQVVIQLVGHEVAHLVVVGQRVTGDQARIFRLVSLVQLLHRWYFIAAIAFVLIAGVAGAVFFRCRGELPLQDWLPAWIALSVCTAINLKLVPVLALIEGTGKVGQVAKLRLHQSAIGYATLWIALISGGGVWAAAAVPLVAAALTSRWVRTEAGLYDWLRKTVCLAENRIDWQKDILPFQWRIAVSWISGYFTFYAFTPLIFSHQGAAEAGRFAMAMTIFNAVSVVGMSWVSTKAPVFGMHISRGERSELNTLFLVVFKRSIVFTSVASLSVIVLAYSLSSHGAAFMGRIAEPSAIACLGLVCILNCVVFSVATYMRAHKEEPMLAVSIAMGIGTALIAYFGSMSSVSLMCLGYFLLNVFVALPWSLKLFLGFYRRGS